MATTERAGAGGRRLRRAGLVLGIDIGTTGVKVEAVDVDEVGHVSAAHEYPTNSPQPGWSEQDPDVVAAATADAFQEVTARVAAAGRTIAGITFSSAMHSVIGLAADGTRLTTSVTWADARARPQAQRLRDSADWMALHHRTGTPVHPMSPLLKLLWFRGSPARDLAWSRVLAGNQGVRVVPARRRAGDG